MAFCDVLDCGCRSRPAFLGTCQTCMPANPPFLDSRKKGKCQSKRGQEYPIHADYGAYVLDWCFQWAYSTSSSLVSLVLRTEMKAILERTNVPFRRPAMERWRIRGLSGHGFGMGPPPPRDRSCREPHKRRVEGNLWIWLQIAGQIGQICSHRFQLLPVSSIRTTHFTTQRQIRPRL